MTKKDYELIAEVIKFRIDYADSTFDQTDIPNLAKDLAAALALQDKRFKHDQFLKDCGV